MSVTTVADGVFQMSKNKKKSLAPVFAALLTSALVMPAAVRAEPMDPELEKVIIQMQSDMKAHHKYATEGIPKVDKLAKEASKQAEQNASNLERHEERLDDQDTRLHSVIEGLQNTHSMVLVNGDQIANNGQAIKDIQTKNQKQDRRLTAHDQALNEKAATDASNIDAYEWIGVLGQGTIADGNQESDYQLVDGVTVYNALNASNTQINQKVDDLADTMDRGFAQVDRRMSRLGATAAALAGMHPLDYDENHHFSGAAAIGHYHGQQAVAVGMFFRPTPKFMFNVGGSAVNAKDAMFNAGMTYRFGKRALDAQTRGELKAQVSDLKVANRELASALNASQAREAAMQDRLTALEAKMNEVLRLRH